MSRTRKLALFLVCAVLLTSLMLVACSGNEEYSIYVRSLGGLGLSDVTVTVKLPDSSVSGQTDSSGKYVLKAKKGVYDVTVSNLPLGYSVAGNNSYKTSADKATLVIYVSSAVIQDTIPDNKVYKEGDVIYDFSITDSTDRENEMTYTLSEVLETKRMVLLNFWNTNCGPCMSEMPALEQTYRQYQDLAEVFGINVPLMGINTWKEVRETKSNMDLTFPLTIDDNEMPFHFAMKAIPVTVVVDRYGVIALIHQGRLDEASFVSMFDKYTSDNYEQDSGLGSDDPNDDPEVPEWAKPNVTQPDSSVIEAAINSDSFNGTYHPETREGDAEYSWPWLVGGSGNEQYIYPSNSGVNYSFATIYTSVTISEQELNNPDGKVVLAFDLQWSCENLGDYFMVYINDEMVYQYTGTEQWGKWQDCYALVADEPGEYTLALLYFKDDLLSEGEDTVRIKNMRLLSINQIEVGSLDMPRNATKNWNGNTYTSYVDVVLGDDGYYHKDSKTGPYVLADLMNATNFNKRLNTSWSISEFATNGYFDYNTVDSDNPSYKEELDDTDAITIWAMAANNSELYGLTVVTPELVGLLNNFIKSQIGNSNFNNKMWLEFCTYFDHYGQDPSDKGICSEERNPIRGLLNVTALPTVDAYQGELNLNNIPNGYKNLVVLDRLLVPRGMKYLFVPTVSGVYRFRTQSIKNADTMSWLSLYENEFLYYDEDYLVTTDRQLENPDQEYNSVITYYLEANVKYIFTTAYADLGVTGEYTFTIEYLGSERYVWQYASRNYFTAADDDMSQVVNYMNVQPVAHEDNDGVVRYYNAKKDTQGNYVKDSSGNYVPNLNDPIYVDFLSGARFFDYGSIQEIFLRGNEDTVRNTVSRIFATLWGKSMPAGGWVKGMALTSIKGSALTDSDWQSILKGLQDVYGDDVYLDDDDIIANNFANCVTMGDVVNVIKTFYLDLFNQKYIEFDEKYGIDPSRYTDYTDLVYSYYQMALNNKGTANRGYVDKGCVQLTEELKDALDMFCKRVGGFPELDTDWIRLCAHFEYMGPNS